MKRKTIAGLIAVVVIVAAAIFAGCVEEETSPTPESIPEPKYVPGDIIAEKPTNEDCLTTVISYNKDTDEYESNYIFRNRDGSWGHFIKEDTSWYGREFLEEYMPTLIAHVDISTITIGEPKSAPTSTSTIPTPKFKKGDIVSMTSDSLVGDAIVGYNKESDEYTTCSANCIQTGKWEATGKDHQQARMFVDNYYERIGEIGETVITQTATPTSIQIKVIYSGSWTGNYADIGSSKSVDGTGTETFTISNPESVVSAAFQKGDDSGRTLTVEILKDGKVVESESTSAAYGVAMVSCSV